MQFGFFEILLMLGFVQGIFLSVILFTHRSNQPANRFLGTAMFFLSIELFSLFINKHDLVDTFIYFLPFFFSLPFIYTPMLFLYVKELTTNKATTRRDLLHFIPFLFSLLIIAGIYLGKDTGIETFLRQVNYGTPFLVSLVNDLKPIYAVIYIFLMLRYINLYNKKIKNSFSSLEKINLNWLRNFSIAMIVITGIVVIQNVSEFIYDEKSVLEIYLFVSIVILIYLIGYFGLKQPEIFSQRIDDAFSKTKNGAKYQKSGLGDRVAEESLNNLLNYMETEKPYLKGDLTLRELADGCGISIHNLSEIINTKLNQSYYDFVNKYRVEEFKRRLEDPENDKFTILSIAYDCGFNSKSSFNTVFKKFMNTTPSEYRKSLLDE